MDIFVCGCCSKKFPTLHRHVHHKLPKSLGGKDIPENLIAICPSCHDTLHSIAQKMLNKKTSPTQILDSLALIYIDNKKAQEICLELALNVRNACIQVKEKGLGPNHIVAISTTLRKFYKPLITARAKELNISQENYIRMLIFDDLSKRFNINANLTEENRLISYIKKEKKKTFERDE